MTGQIVRTYYPGMKSLMELREQTGKARSKVAAELDMSERHLYRLEHGLSPLRRVTVLALANYYGVKPDEITVNDVAA